MRLFFAGVIVSLLIVGCGERQNNATVTPGKTQPPPVEKPDPTPPKPKPFSSCIGTRDFSTIEIWWVESTPLKMFYSGALNPCKNSTSNGGLDMVIKFPAAGSTLDVNGEIKTFWMMAKVLDESGNEHRYYQYSDFFSRTETCSQGQFKSENGDLIGFRENEPRSGLGAVTFNNTEIALRCLR